MFPMKLSDAVELAVTECIREGILEEFLRKNRAEVISMSIFEFDEEREWKLIRETEYQYGVEDGKKLNLIEGICKKLQKGKNASIIAEELEEELSVVQNICEIASRFAPEYDVEKIYQMEQKLNV